MYDWDQYVTKTLDQIPTWRNNARIATYSNARSIRVSYRAGKSTNCGTSHAARKTTNSSRVCLTNRLTKGEICMAIKLKRIGSTGTYAMRRRLHSASSSQASQLPQAQSGSTVSPKCSRMKRVRQPVVWQN